MISVAFLSILFDAFGVLVGTVSILLAIFVLYYNPETYDEGYVAALYIVGVLLLALAGERPLSHSLTSSDLPIVFGRFLMYVGVAYWDLVVFSHVFDADEDDVS